MDGSAREDASIKMAATRVDGDNGINRAVAPKNQNENPTENQDQNPRVNSAPKAILTGPTALIQGGNGGANRAKNPVKSNIIKKIGYFLDRSAKMTMFAG